MKLSEYLIAVGESETSFAKRADLPQRTINRIAAGEVNCRVDTAQRIVLASYARRTPSGGFVTFEELITE